MGADMYREPSRDTPVVERRDVIVCGGGPAGVGAAVAAARAGARTRLFEVHGCLGGVWTAGLLSWIIDAHDKPGLMREILTRLDQRGARVDPHGNSYAYDVEVMKWLLDDLCTEAGVAVELHTRVVGAPRDDRGRIAVVITESKSGRQAWSAKAYVDATGDGDLSAAAGCGFDLGHDETHQTQPMSLIALVGGVDARAVEPFITPGDGKPKQRLLAELARAGVSPSYGAPTLFRIRDDLLTLMANHEYGVSAVDAGATSAATRRARAEVHRLVGALRGLGGVWRGLHVIATGDQIGVREGRRIHGRYRVTVDDLVRGARHADAVCRVTFGIDVHSTDPSTSTSFAPENRTRTQPYDIPLRALIARDVDGLLVAGRCISGDFLAHASYRVSGNAVAMGQAAGVAAALSAHTGTLPHELTPAEVVNRLP